MVAAPGLLGRLVADAMGGDGTVAARRWAASGAMSLTGPPETPDVGPGRVALAMDALAADIATWSARVGTPVHVDGAALLAERAACTGFGRQGATSCGGATRLLSTGDGIPVALSLARDDDRTLLPALVGLLGLPSGMAALDGASCSTEPGGPAASDGSAASATRADWAVAARAASSVAAAAFVEAAAELGLAVARCGEVTKGEDLVGWTPLPLAAPRRGGEPWLVVDLSSLWAGPLCAHLLGLAGARVVKVESTRRPDGARSGPATFFDVLHAGHECVAIDFTTRAGQGALRDLLSRADVVIEASRPRALAALGTSYADLRAAGWRGLWVSITGHGRLGAAAERVAFGDDAAIAGGLIGGPLRPSLGPRPLGAATAPPATNPRPQHHPTQTLGATATAPAANPRPGRDGVAGWWFVADAVADPATGLVAAAAALRALANGQAGLLAVSLATTAAHLAAGVTGHPAPQLPDGVEPASPRARPATGRAPALGQHDGVWLR